MKLATTMGTGLALSGGLAAVTALGRKIDDEQSARFAFDLDADYAALLQKGGITVPPGTRLFSEPARPGSLDSALSSAECRIDASEDGYVRTAAITFRDGGGLKQLTAVREYDGDSLPTDISAEMIRSASGFVAWRIYDGVVQS